MLKTDPLSSLSLPALSRAARELIGSSLACRDSDHANVLVLTKSQAHQNITTAITQSWGRPNEHMLPTTATTPSPIPKLLFMCLI